MPEGTLTPREAELQRRLDTVAARATVDATAWERIKERIGDTERSSPRRLLPGPSRRVVAAAAAVVLVVVGVAALSRRGDSDRVDTIDDPTGTTIDGDGRSPTTLPPAPPPGEITPGDQPTEGEASGSGTGADGGSGAPRPPDNADTPSGTGTGAAPTTTPTTAPDPNVAPDGRVPAMQ